MHHQCACFLTSFSIVPSSAFQFFFFNDTATTEIYTLSLHDALPISLPRLRPATSGPSWRCGAPPISERSEEHTSELQSHSDLVCRLLLEKKKTYGASWAFARRTRLATPLGCWVQMRCCHGRYPSECV